MYILLGGCPTGKHTIHTHNFICSLFKVYNISIFIIYIYYIHIGTSEITHRFFTDTYLKVAMCGLDHPPQSLMIYRCFLLNMFLNIKCQCCFDMIILWINHNFDDTQSCSVFPFISKTHQNITPIGTVGAEFI